MPSRALLAMASIAFSEPKPQNKPGKPFPVWGQWNKTGQLLSKHRQTQARGVEAGGDVREQEPHGGDVIIGIPTVPNPMCILGE